MKYFKKIGITTIGLLIFFVFVKVYFFAPTVKLSLEKQNITLSPLGIKISGDVIAFKEGCFKIYFSVGEYKKVKEILFPEKVVMLKKGQLFKIDSEYTLDDIYKTKEKLYFTAVVEEMFPKKKKIVKNMVIETPKTMITKVSEKQELPKVFDTKKIVEKNLITISSPSVSVTTHKIPEVGYSTVPIVSPGLKSVDSVSKTLSTAVVTRDVKMSSDGRLKYEVNITTADIAQEYYYDGTIQVKLTIKNNGSAVLRPTVNIVLKDTSGIVISSSTQNYTVTPKEVLATTLETKIASNVSPGNYFLEYIVNIDSKEIFFVSPKFVLIDKKPKISLPEIPQIKYKITNTILAEVEDDRGIKSVKFIETHPKSKKENINPMILVAGNTRFGLYSFTTKKIDFKGTYKFFIKAEDISGNIEDSNIYEVKIIKK